MVEWEPGSDGQYFDSFIDTMIFIVLIQYRISLGQPNSIDTRPYLFINVKKPLLIKMLMMAALVAASGEIVVDGPSSSTPASTSTPQHAIQNKRSIVWSYFKDSGNKEATCDICGGIVSTAGNTSNMLKAS